ncbi:MAG: transposase [Bryobacterales bacterium]|nr:transposase [Bryobacterales bacterium]
MASTYVKARLGGCVVSVAMTIAVAINERDRREVLGIAVGTSEAESLGAEWPGADRAGCGWSFRMMTRHLRQPSSGCWIALGSAASCVSTKTG